MHKYYPGDFVLVKGSEGGYLWSNRIGVVVKTKGHFFDLYVTFDNKPSDKTKRSQPYGFALREVKPVFPLVEVV